MLRRPALELRPVLAQRCYLRLDIVLGEPDIAASPERQRWPPAIASVLVRPDALDAIAPGGPERGERGIEQRVVILIGRRQADEHLIRPPFVDQLLDPGDQLLL